MDFLCLGTNLRHMLNSQGIKQTTTVASCDIIVIIDKSSRGLVPLRNFTEETEDATRPCSGNKLAPSHGFHPKMKQKATKQISG